MQGLELKVQRVRAKVTQAQVAALLGVSQTVVWAIESGKGPLADVEAAAVLRAIELAATGKTIAAVPLGGRDVRRQG